MCASAKTVYEDICSVMLCCVLTYFVVPCSGREIFHRPARIADKI